MIDQIKALRTVIYSKTKFNQKTSCKYVVDFEQGIRVKMTLLNDATKTRKNFFLSEIMRGNVNPRAATDIRLKIITVLSDITWSVMNQDYEYWDNEKSETKSKKWQKKFRIPQLRQILYMLKEKYGIWIHNFPVHYPSSWFTMHQEIEPGLTANRAEKIFHGGKHTSTIANEIRTILIFTEKTNKKSKWF